MASTVCVKSDRLIPQPDGSVTVRYHDPQHGEGVLSIQPDGSFGWRPAGTAGPWECAKRDGHRLVFSDSAYPVGGYAVLVAD